MTERTLFDELNDLGLVVPKFFSYHLDTMLPKPRGTSALLTAGRKARGTRDRSDHAIAARRVFQNETPGRYLRMAEDVFNPGNRTAWNAGLRELSHPTIGI